ncbi:Uncharacterised protein [Kingella denitrificans]|uniref:Uncharacterized protein n=1 Tax=Kingella denitrificans ATCC 33394 TaxID=888741 RepID=F0F1H6_9NEIS|nr:hypothetical protein [Kingella denitrificans]EGC16591.1 hypothetical protein HMPREF9098_1961 [Kingella denitrificans ATCC 33394]QQB42412.1 hypothetical protein I6I17_02305 [Kingella denitrificans]STR11668.1 Uncharacterised protein [Kingella denitrificans]
MPNTKIAIDSSEFIVKLVEYFDENYIENLEQTYKLCETRIEVNPIKQPKNCVGCNLASYEYLYSQKQDTSYHCQQENFIYAIRTMPLHAEEIEHAFLKIENNNDKEFFALEFLENKSVLNMASVGYACGTDVLGILKLLNRINIASKTYPVLHNINQIRELNILRIDDQKENWDISAQAVQHFINDFGYIKENFDFSVLNESEAYNDFCRRIDLFTLSYVYNELDKKEKIDIFNKIIELASTHFLILINDYNAYSGSDHKLFINEFNEYCDNNFKLINSVRVDYNGEGASFKKAMNDWVWKLPNFETISFRDKYRMKTNMKSICYIYEFERA